MSKPIVSENESNSNNLPQALELAALGFFVFPCEPLTEPDKKRPIKTGGINPKTKEPYRLAWGSKATTDQATIEQWWKRWPQALIGIYCERSGVFALDIDNKNGVSGSTSWGALVEKHGNGQGVIVGPAQATPNGGYHLIFRYPTGTTIPNWEGQLAPGLDLRSAGYVCTGGAYEWLPEHTPKQQLTDAPAWLPPALFILGGAVLTGASGLVLWQQPALYTVTLALGALGWLAGNAVWGWPAWTSAPPCRSGWPSWYGLRSPSLTMGRMPGSRGSSTVNGR